MAAVKNAENHRDSHWLGQIPNQRAFTLLILTTIPDMPSESSWRKGRAVELSCDKQEEAIPPVPDRRYLSTIKCTRVFLTDDQNNARPPTFAQFAKTIKSIAEFANVLLIRYVSDSAAAEERVPLPVDLNEVLKKLGETYETHLSDQLKTCRKFLEGHIWYEYYAARDDGLLDIPEDERENYIVADWDVSKNIKAMDNILFEVNP
ncbi:unnamed protein product [Heligmosomoides polygyrus]|uniref:Uncharacterized protein n=1 Tax=Heligmosomoides polygyrus TaxID=6339 RepID=A0A3P7XNY8_HELPZ|nr:unnamed protein product [Heligmosomoides polygyrus]